ncbi:MAG: hypothetical protein Q4D41_04085 [Prevotellaceae bacterium]|nr:hypothetical protein [Prevotellaceae bacterium]
MIIKKIIDKLHDTLFRAIERHDLTAWEHTPLLSRPVYGVYHIYCDKDWQKMVNDQISRLKDSGLMDVTTRLYISCISKNTNDAKEILDIVGSDKAEIISNTTDPTVFEYPALTFLHEKSQSEECFLYYFHTKGISYQATGNTDKRFNRFKENIEAWRHMMEYFLFYKWNVAVNALSSDYDVYGCYRLPPPPKPYYLYAGNFWWAKSEYISKLQKFSLEKLSEGRFFAEEWLYTGNPNDFSAFDTMADLYYINMEECLYADKKPPLYKTIAYIIKYNFHKFRKHVLKYNYKAEYQKKYQKLRNKDE